MALVTPGPLENDLVRMACDAGKRKEIEALTDCPVPLSHKSPLSFTTNRLCYSVRNRSSGIWKLLLHLYYCTVSKIVATNIFPNVLPLSPNFYLYCIFFHTPPTVKG